MSTVLSTRCCIAGGGPAGMMCGLLLARSGVDVTVLEKHEDFLRDFRGDTIHPSTLSVMEDLGLLEEFLSLRHERVDRLTANVFGQAVTIADFTRLKSAQPYLVLMPQWDFLDFLARKARAYPNFHLHMGTRATAVIEREGAVVGVHADAGGEALEIRCRLAVAADGRHTTLRDSAGLPTVDFGAPIDVLWFRLSRQTSAADAQTGGYVRPGLFLVAINRDTYWQCGYVIPKGSIDGMRWAGLEALKANVAECAPFLKASLPELRSWDDLKLLTVQISRMPRWHREGLLCIGDAAHAMSPVGGVGINLAIQDAVAAANLLADRLREDALQSDHLAAVQRRRDWPTRVTQRLQMAVQNEVLAPVLAGRSDRSAASPESLRSDRSAASPALLPLPLQLLRRLPFLSRIPARIVGVGVRPERVSTRPRPTSSDDAFRT